MANTANLLQSTLVTDFNVIPYYDDYDATKEYYKVLFKPGFAVQARELTTLQTMLQKQIARFGKHVFEEGSIVLPGGFNLMTANTEAGPVHYVKVKDTDNSNNVVNINQFLNASVTGQTSNISAEISFVADGSEANSNTKTIFVDYKSISSSNSSITKFQPGEVLVANSIGNLVVMNTSPTGTGSAFSIFEGVFFAKDHFIQFETQSIILNRYNDKPSCKVGFSVSELITDYADDTSLLDPALESSNYSAPGADRLRLSPTLSVVDINDPVGPPNFVTLFTVKDGILQTTFERPQYNILQDELAKRTYDESGDYYVDGLAVTLREHLDDGTNGGYKTSANGGNANLISVQVASGVAYCKGYEVGIPPGVTTYLSTDKALDYQNVNSQLASASLGSYITLNEFTGAWGLDKGTEILLYDKPMDRLSNGLWSTGAQTGNNIGTAKFMSIEYNSGTLATANGQVDVYLADIRMTGSNNFSTTRSFYYNNASTADMGGDVVLDPLTNTAILKETTLVPLFYVGSDHTKTLNPGGVSDTTFYWKTSTDVSISTGGTITLPLPTGADLFPYGTTTLSEAQKRDILLVLNDTVNLSQAGTVSNNGVRINGSGTSFTNLNVGDKLEFGGVSGTYYISAIANSTALDITSAPATTVSAAAYSKVYKVGDVIDLSTKGANTGVVRSVSATPSQLAFTIGEGYASTKSATVSYVVAIEGALSIGKTLRKERFVTVNCASHSANTIGPYGLGFSDVLRIKEIRKKTGAFSSNTEGSDVTSSFIFDNGQRDHYYDHATITPKITLASSDHLLVRLDYFYPDFSVGHGFYSKDSYNSVGVAEIPVFKSPTSGTTYDLRNHLDFRPIKSITATDATTVGTASANPASSSGFNFDSNGMRFVSPSSQITYDYEYYLARKDIVTLSKDGQFGIIRGTPAEVAVTPGTPDSLMSIATISLTPYPSLSLYYAKQLSRKDLACIAKRTASVRFTMRDIGVLKERIINLEYYQALSLLEKAAADLVILDANGLDRFKNGIFVDTFTSHILGATYNTDYRIVVDPKEKSIRPLYTMDSTYYDYVSGSSVVQKGDLILLSYTEVALLSQTNVTTTRNTERTTWRFLGAMVLNPELDVWVDTQFAPDSFLDFGPTDEEITELEGGLITEWDAWRSFVTGYNVYRAPGGTSVVNQQNFVGTYATLTEASRAANSVRSRVQGAIIETLRASERSGIEDFLVVDESTQAMGDKLIDVSLQPFIRPQAIKIIVRGLKPYAPHYVFFDGIDMSAYVTVLTQAEFDASVLNNTTATEGAAITVPYDGDLKFLLRLPSAGKRFTFGTKEIVVTDSPTNNKEDATSISTGYFVAQGLTQTKQDTIITTRQVIPQERVVEQGRIDPSTFQRIAPIPPRRSGSCMAYTLTINAPNDEDGIFLTSVDVFCSAKHPTLDIWVEVRETNSAGGITQNMVPFSDMWIENANVPISTNGTSNPLHIEFRAPLFLQNKKTYAFILHPEALNPNYYFWVSRLGQTDINTGNQINSRALTGALYTTNNGVVWDLVPDVDLTCKFYRANFSATSGTVTLGNAPREKFILSNVSSSLSRYGETFSTGNKLTLSGITGGTVNVTDYIIGTNSGANGTVQSISGSIYRTSNTKFINLEPIRVRRANGYLSSVNANVSAISTASAVLQKYKESANLISAVMTKSNGSFEVGDTIYNFTTNDNAVISKIENFRYSVIDPEPAFLTFNKTSMAFDIKPYSNTGIAGAFTGVTPNDNYYFNTEQAIYSRSNEVTAHSGTKTNQLKATMRSSSVYVSPVLDIGSSQSIIIDNYINSNTTGENGAAGGYLWNKYISKTVTLAEGQDAEDIKLLLTAYRPPGTDIKVWIKALHAEDVDLFAQRTWIEMDKIESDTALYSSLSNRNDFLEYEFKIPAAYMIGTGNRFKYTNSKGISLEGYKYFAIKIGLLADNTAIVPRVADLRTVAIQM